MEAPRSELIVGVGLDSYLVLLVISKYPAGIFHRFFTSVSEIPCSLRSYSNQVTTGKPSTLILVSVDL